MEKDFLKKEEVLVRKVDEGNIFSTDKKHIMSLGMIDGTKKTYYVPTYNGVFVEVLNEDECRAAEEILGLEKGSMNRNKVKNNYWAKYKIEVPKDGLTLHLDNINDYIAYKVLVANKSLIADSLETLKNRRLLSYEFFISKANEEATEGKKSLDVLQKAFNEYAKIDKKKDEKRIILELMMNTVLSEKMTDEEISNKYKEYLVGNPQKFLNTISDKHFEMKKFIQKALQKGVLCYKGLNIILKSNQMPLSAGSETADMLAAVSYLENPAHSDVKALIESQMI